MPDILDLKTIEKALLDGDKYVRKAGILASRYYNSYADVMDDWWDSSDINFKIAACFSYYGANRMLPRQRINKVIHQCAEMYGDEFASNLLLFGFKRGSLVTSQFPPNEFSNFYSEKLLKRCAESIMISTPMLVKCLYSTEWYNRCLGLYISLREECEKLPLSFIYPSLESMDPAVREAGILAVRHFKPNQSYLVGKFLEAKNCSSYRETLMRVCQGRNDVILPLDPNVMLRGELIAMRGLHVDPSLISAWQNGTYLERTAALYAIADEPNVPFVLINRGLRDGDPLLHEAAIIAAKMHGYPSYRVFEPSDIVYKKCIGNVVITARIPEDAEVRGDPHDGARASKAEIIDIENDFFGNKIGLSFYDCSTIYEIGKPVVISDFDSSLDDCSNGFHFFGDYKLARKFYY